jgi:hypothetical protein
MYPLTERHPLAGRMQDEFMAEVESAKPALAVLIRHRSSWVATLQPDLRANTWVGGFLTRCYEQVAASEMPEGVGVYRRKGC